MEMASESLNYINKIRKMVNKIFFNRSTFFEAVLLTQDL